jgi:hypothetical protein
MLVLTLIIISAAVSITTYLTYVGFAYISFARIMTDKKRAETLAFSGIECAISQLAHHEFGQEQDNEKKTERKRD